jgi:hypothetical protein
MTYVEEQREKASRWKSGSGTLPEEARIAAPYVGKGGVGGDTAYPFCLPAEHAALNLLPEVRTSALELFAELGIPWHCGVDRGPSNHLLSSQVQCVNALMPMVEDPARTVKAFGDLLDIAEVLEIEDGRFLTFEYVGPADHLHEARGGARTRGAHCTSVDAAFRYRTPAGRTELALVEWKYTESYLRRRKAAPASDAVRTKRYGDLWEAPDGPLVPRVPLDLMFDEPFYQLMRQQLLAHELERHGAEDAEVVRVLHVLDPANGAYQASVLRPEMRGLGDTVDGIWSSLLRDPSRFLHVDPARFLDPTLTCAEYVARYS